MRNDYQIAGDVTTISLHRPGSCAAATTIDTADLVAVLRLRGFWRLDRRRVGTDYCYGLVDGKKVYLHRFLIGNPGKADVDHINGDGLDNRRGVNLRVVKHAINVQNRRGAQRNSLTGVRGVYWDTWAGRWKAQIGVGGVVRHLGRFDTLEEARVAAITARLETMPGYVADADKPACAA